MRIINLTSRTININSGAVKDLAPLSISQECTMTRELIMSSIAPLINQYEDNLLVVVSDLEKANFSNYGIIFPLVNTRDYSDIEEYIDGQDVPPGWKVITDYYYVNPETKVIEPKKFIVQLPSNLTTPLCWEDM